MKNTISHLVKNLLFTIGFFFVGAGILSAAGTWTAPTATAPNGNVDAPINTGLDAQFKLGQLNVNTDTTNPYAVGFTTWGQSIFNGNLTVTNTVPNQTRITLNERGDVAGQHSGVELRENSALFGGIFKSKTSNNIEIWRASAPVITVKQNGNVDIGTTSLPSKLSTYWVDATAVYADVLQIQGGAPGVGKVLKSQDALGTAYWADASGSPSLAGYSSNGNGGGSEAIYGIGWHNFCAITEVNSTGSEEPFSCRTYPQEYDAATGRYYWRTAAHRVWYCTVRCINW